MHIKYPRTIVWLTLAMALVRPAFGQVRISQFPAAVPPILGAEIFWIDRDPFSLGSSRKVTVTQLFGNVLNTARVLTDPGGDRIGFWDDSAGAFTWLDIDPASLVITGTTLSVIGASLADGDKGDITISVGGTVWQIDSRSVTDSKIEYGVSGVTSAAGTLTFDFNGTRRQTNSEAGALTIAFANKPVTSVDRWLLMQFSPTGVLTPTWPATVAGSPVRQLSAMPVTIGAGEFTEIYFGWNGYEVLLDKIGTGAGSVTSVGLTVPGGFAVSGSPVTTNGTLAVTTTGQQPYYFLRGDFNGSSTWDNTLIYSNANNTTTSAFGSAKRGRIGDATGTPASGGILGQYRVGGWNAANIVLAGGMSGFATEDWTGAANGHDLQFYVVTNTSAFTTLAMTIGQDTKVKLASASTANKYLGTDGSGNIVITNGVPGTHSTSAPLVSTEFWIYDDFIGNGLDAGLWANQSSGTSAAIAFGSATYPDANHWGVVDLTTGTTTTGRAAFYAGSSTVNQILLGGGEALFTAIVRVPVLSDGTDTYVLRVGFGDSATADFVDGVYFEHRETTGDWYLKAASNSTRSEVQTTTAVSTAAWIRLDIVVNAAGTSVTGYINGTEVVATAGTYPIVSNIPTGAGRVTGIITSIIKSAGTTARLAYVDAISSSIQFTTPR